MSSGGVTKHVEAFWRSNIAIALLAGPLLALACGGDEKPASAMLDREDAATSASGGRKQTPADAGKGDDATADAALGAEAGAAADAGSPDGASADARPDPDVSSPPATDARVTPIPYDGDIGPSDAGEPEPPCPEIPANCTSYCEAALAGQSCQNRYASVEECECQCAREIGTACASELDDLISCASTDRPYGCGADLPRVGGPCQDASNALFACARPEVRMCSEVSSCLTYCEAIAPADCENAEPTFEGCSCWCENELTVFRNCTAELDAFAACHDAEPATFVCKSGFPTLQSSGCQSEWDALEACSHADAGAGSEI